MDRETLSHYGWIVILVLILSCLLAFATPFGRFVGVAISNIGAGFVDTNNEALSNEHIQNIQDKWEEQLNDCEHEYTRLANQKTATCQSAGYTGDKVCNGCGKTMETGTVIEKLDHTTVTDEAVPATCEQEGKTEGSHCSSCNTVLVAQITTDALGHDWGDPYVATEATCLGNGVSRIDCQRDGCDAHTDSTIEAEGHTIVTVTGKTATCTATGLTNGEKCSVCGTVTTEQQVIPALGHTEVNDSAIQASCEVAGKTAGVHCSVCNTVIKAQETVPALGHNMGTPVTTLTATCTTEGQTKTSCQRTGCGYYEIDSIPAKGHTEVIDKAVPATCTATGLTEGKHCSVCNAVLTAQTTVKALGHEMSETVTTLNATCTTVGETKTSCSRCDYYVTGTIDALGHEYNSVTKEATCTEGGSTITTCSRCGDSSTTTTAALGHNYTATITTEATCTTTGVRTYTCSRCGDSYTESIAATGHLHTEIRNADDSTGYTGDTYCKDCGKIISYGQYIIPEGGTYTTADGTVYEEGDAFPSTVTDGDTYSYGEYEYKYNYRLYSSPGIGLWEANTSQNGWGVRYLYDRANPAPMLESINGKPITSMRYTFYQCRSVVVAPEIPSTVTDMYYAFGSCYKLTTVGKLPSGLKNLIRAFSSCTALTKAPAIPSTVTEMGSCFTGCKALTDISAVTIPNGVTDITNIFNSCAFTSIDLSSNTSITIVKGFNNNTSLKSVILPSNTRVINTYAFKGCTSLTSITIPASITKIGMNSFENCTSLTSIDLSDCTKLVTIDYYAFKGCTSLTSITIPASAKTIGGSAFYGCTSLTTITFNGTTAQWNAISKGTDWNYNIPATEVICSDGTVSLS